MAGAIKNLDFSQSGEKRPARLAILTTHPIQYNAPLFRLLSERGAVQVRVFYSWGEDVMNHKYDPGFSRSIEWDIPLLEGYDSVFLENKALRKGSDHFRGIINPGIIHEVESFRPDALLVYGWPFHSHMKAMRYFKGKIPVLFRGDSHLLDKIGVVRRLLRKITLRFVFRMVDMAFYAGISNKQYFQWAGLRESALAFLPHAVDNERFGCSDSDCLARAEQLREKWGIRTDDFVFLFAGKWESKKAPVLLIEAFIKAGFPDRVKLLLVGDGMLESEIRERCRNMPSVIISQFVNQSLMPSVYQVSDVFVLPSAGPGETWGLSVNEAMANGKAVIVSDKCGCAADLVEGMNTGIVFKAGDQKGLSLALRKLFDDSTMLNQMKNNAQVVISSYSFREQARIIENTVNLMA